MNWLDLVSYFFGGAFLSNAAPHLVSSVMGRPFQSPFARPPGQGLSSSIVNVLWGFFNLVIAYLLVFRVGRFEARDTADIVAFGLGLLLMSLLAARHFGRFNGGNARGGVTPEPVFAPTGVDAVFGSLKHEGPTRSIEGMDAAIVAAAKRRADD